MTLGEDLFESAARLINSGALLHEAMYINMIVYTRGWNRLTNVGVLTKVDSSWNIEGIDFTYSATFAYRFFERVDTGGDDESGSVAGASVNFDESYDRYYSLLTRGNAIGEVRITVSGQTDSFQLGELMNEPSQCYNMWSRHRAANIRATQKRAVYDCTSANSYRLYAEGWIGSGLGNSEIVPLTGFAEFGIHLEPGENTKIWSKPKESTYTGWMPGDLGDTVIRDKEFSLCRIHGTPLTVRGNNLGQIWIDERVHVSNDSNVTVDGKIYPLAAGIYYLDSGTECKNPLEYSRWASPILSLIKIESIPSRALSLESFGEQCEGMVMGGRKRQISEFSRTGPAGPVRGSAKKITEM